MAMGTPDLGEANTWPLWTPAPPLPGAGQGGTEQISNPSSGLGLFINFPGKDTHTHTQSHSLPFPQAPRICGQGLGSSDEMTATPFLQGSLSSQQEGRSGPSFPASGLQAGERPPQKRVRRITWGRWRAEPQAGPRWG